MAYNHVFLQSLFSQMKGSGLVHDMSFNPLLSRYVAQFSLAPPFGSAFDLPFAYPVACSVSSRKHFEDLQTLIYITNIGNKVL